MYIKLIMFTSLVRFYYRLESIIHANIALICYFNVVFSPQRFIIYLFGDILLSRSTPGLSISF